MSFTLILQIVAGVWAGFCILMADYQLMMQTESWPARTLCLAGGLAALWVLIPALLGLIGWLISQLPLVLLALAALCCLARPRPFS